MANSRILVSLFRFAGKGNRSCKPSSAPGAEYSTLKQFVPFSDASQSPSSCSTSTNIRYASCKSADFEDLSRASKRLSVNQAFKSGIGIADDISTALSEDINSEDHSEVRSAVYRPFNAIRKPGYAFDEDTYGPFLIYLIDKTLINEFLFFCDLMSDGNLFSFPRLGYYQMLLWIRINDEMMIEACCNFIADNDKEDTIKLRENYLLALCKCDRKHELVGLLEMLDLRPYSIMALADIFKSLGRLSLEPLAENLILYLKECDKMSDHISELIYSYSTSILNLELSDAVREFHRLHAKSDVAPSWSSYEKLVSHCCDLDQFQLAMELLVEMGHNGHCCSINTMYRIEKLCTSFSEIEMLWGAVSCFICGELTAEHAESMRRMIRTYLLRKDFKTGMRILFQLTEGRYLVTDIRCRLFRAMAGDEPEDEDQ